MKKTHMNKIGSVVNRKANRRSRRERLDTSRVSAREQFPYHDAELITCNPGIRERSIIVKKTSMLIAVVFVVGAIAQSALAQNLVRFSGGIGDIPTGSANTTVRGVAAAGQIWVIRDLIADVKQDGSVRVDGRGLLLGAGDGVGSNGNASVFATLFCASDGNVQHSSSLAGVKLEVNGDFRIDDSLSPTPPNPCASPVLLIRVTGNGGWFAAGIAKD
jgi:hypothetical protein